LVFLLRLLETSYFITFLFPCFISRGYLISPSLVIPAAVSSPLSTCSVDFW
jgi:hypothetical protein